MPEQKSCQLQKWSCTFELFFSVSCTIKRFHQRVQKINRLKHQHVYFRNSPDTLSTPWQTTKTHTQTQIESLQQQQNTFFPEWRPKSSSSNSSPARSLKNTECSPPSPRPHGAARNSELLEHLTSSLMSSHRRKKLRRKSPLFQHSDTLYMTLLE